MKGLLQTIMLSLMLLAAESAVGLAADIYQINPLTESELMSMYTNMLIDGCRYADTDWHEWSVDPRGGYWGDGTTSGNSGTRAVTSMVLACGALLKYCDSLTQTDRTNFKTKSIAAIRFLTATHVTGPQTCIDGKKWGDGWGSAYCSGMFGWGAWLIWDDLDSGLKADVQRVLAHEADRFLTTPPPSGPPGDTKAEENAWNQMGISIAARLFPEHEHASGWSNKTIEYAMNTLSVAQDEQDNTVVDGKPVSEWVCTANLNPDFTLENHNIFHPSYMQCSIYLLVPSIMQCIYSGQPIPQGLTHHMTDVWDVFKSLLLPYGETAFPQGMDWELHNLPAINLFAFLATYMDDAVAASAEKTIIQYMRAWQQSAGGSLTVPGSTLGFTRHSIQCEQVADAYLAHKLFGPATTAPPPAVPEFVRYYSYVQTFLHRTHSKLVSFSWKNKVMGMIVPIGAGHEASPFFTVPITNGLIGTTTLTTGSTSVTDAGHTWRNLTNGGETSGTLITNDGMLRQQVRVTSVGQKAVVYQDLVTATTDVTVKAEQGISLGIENDSISGGTRIVYHKNGSTSFDWRSPKPTTTIPGTWANVDGRLGIVVVTGSGMAYAQASSYSPGIAVYRDILYGSYSSAKRTFGAGAQVARRTAILLTEVTPAETSAVAQSVTIVNGPNGQVLRFNLPEGGTAEVTLGFAVPAITPDSAALPPRGTQQFTLSASTPPVTWQVINQSTAGVGTVDSNGLFTAEAVGTCQLRAIDALGNTDESGVITVAYPTISPSTPVRVVRWKTVTFAFTPSSGDVTWQVIDESGPAGTVGKVDSSGVFTATGQGTCRVRAVDSLGNTGTSGLITVVSPGAYDYTPDANTVALYHLDEATGNTWLDSSGNGINATANAIYPVSHVSGIFGNAAGEFGWENSNASFLTTASSTKFQNPELTAECWVYFPAGVDILAATADGSIRGIVGYRVGGNSWSLCAGSWPATPPYGVPGGVNFVYWGTPNNVFVYSTARVFYNEIWYHVAVTYKPLGTTPETYQTKIYVTPQGTTTPVLVAEATTPNRMLVTATGLYIGNESSNNARKFPGYVDEVRISSRVRTQEELSWTLGGITAPDRTIGEAKNSANGAYVTVTGVVSARLSDCSYLEAADRSAGIRLAAPRPLGIEAGDVATVVGKLDTVDGERCLEPVHVEKTATLFEQSTSKGINECTF